MTLPARFLLPASILLALALSSCRDLSLPRDELTTDDGGAGRQSGLALLTPDEAAATVPVPRALVVRLRASAQNGVGEVELSCGTALLKRWNGDGAGAGAAPLHFEESVDLLPCLVGAETTQTVRLKAIARDTTALPVGVVEREVLVDTRLPIAPLLTYQLPARLIVGRSTSFEVRSNMPLARPPSVAVDGLAGAATPIEGAQPEGTAFLVTLPPLALVTSGEPNNLELEATERQALVSLSARGTNGYAVHLRREAKLTRVLWERQLPGELFSPEREFGRLTAEEVLSPVATPAGLVVPMKRGEDGFLPALLTEAEGDFVPASEALHRSGSAGLGLTRSGATLLATADGGTALLRPDGALREFAVPPPRTEELARLGSGLCQHYFGRQGVNGNCEPAEHRFRCFGEELALEPFAPYVGADRSALVGLSPLLLGGADRFYVLELQPVDYECPPTAERLGLVVGAEGTTTLPFPNLFAACEGCWPSYVRGEDGSILSYEKGVGDMRWFDALGAPRPLPASFDSDNESPLLITAEGTLASVAVVEGPNLELRWHSEGSPRVTRFPARYGAPTRPQDASGPPLILRTEDGAHSEGYLMVRLSDSSFLLAFEVEGKPRFVYPYPGGGSPPLLVGADGGGVLYLVDYRLQRITALAR